MILLRRARLLVTDAGGEARGGRRDTGRLPCAPCWRKPRLTTSANASSCPRKRSRGGKPHGTEAVTTSGAGSEHRPGACKDRENPREPTQAICQGNTGLGRGPRLPWCCVLRTCLPSPHKYHMLFNGSIGRKDHFSGVRPLEVMPPGRWPQKVQHEEIERLAAGLLVSLTGHMHGVWKFEP